MNVRVLGSGACEHSLMFNSDVRPVSHVCLTGEFEAVDVQV